MNEVKLRQQFDQFLSSVKNLKGTESFYEYESKFIELSQEFSKELFENLPRTEEKKSHFDEVRKDRDKQ